MKQMIALGALALAACGQQSEITCHEMIGGVPASEATVYELVGSDLYRHAVGEEGLLISSEGKRVKLSRTEDDQGPMDSFAFHTLRGDMLTRTVLWQRAGQAPRTAFIERYDFTNQTIVDGETGEDSCYHNAGRNGQTQQ